VPRTEGRSRPQHDPTPVTSIPLPSSIARGNDAVADGHGLRPGMAYAELHLLDGSTLLDNRRDVGQHQLEHAMNHWLEAGTAPLLIHDGDDSLTLVPRSSVLWIRVTDQPG